MTSLRSVPLATWLGLGSVVVVCVAVVAVALSSVGLLEELADQEGLSRAQLAAASAHEFLERTHDGVAASARLLASLPGLRRLVDEGNPERLRTYLENFCEGTSAVEGCAVVDGATYVARSAPGLPWDKALAAFIEDGRKFMLVPDADGPVVLGASSRVRGGPESLRTITLKRLDQPMLDSMAEQVGTAVRLVAPGASPAADGWTGLHTAAEAERRPVSRRLERPQPRYAASMPLPLAAGEPVLYIDVDLEARPSDAIVGALARRLGTTALVIVSIAGLVGALYGLWLTRPVHLLARAAQRLGQGDFATDIPRRGVPEVARLGASMDEMRRNLVSMTAELRQREAEANAVLAGIVEGVIAVDPGRRIRYANPQVMRMLGRDADDVVGRFCGDVLHPGLSGDERPCERDCPILEARQGHGQGVATERVRRTDGAFRNLVVVSAGPAAGQQVVVLRDETELEAVRRARDSVLASVTHEFRTPLAAQLASIELLQDHFATMSAAERQKVIHNLQRGGLRLMNLIDNLLESVRIDAGQLAIRRHPVSLPEVLAQAEELMRPLLDQRGQRLVASFPVDLPDVLGDGTRLTQVFVNLISNAVKFAPEGSDIHVGAESAGGGIAAWVEDEGPGVAPADAGEIFTAFRRSTREEPKAPGLGIGLWIVRSIVERHQGRIHVERTAQGRTRFRIELPLGVAA